MERPVATYRRDPLALANELLDVFTGRGGSTNTSGIESLLIQAHIDESGKFHDRDVITVSGLLSSPDYWRLLNGRWLDALEKCHLPYLHVKEVKDRSILQDFSKIIRMAMAPTFGIGVTVSLDVRAWKSLTSEQQRSIQRPDLAIFEMLIAAMLCLGQNLLPPDFDVALTCDDEEETAFPIYRLWRKVRIRNPELAKKVVSICFCDDSKYPALQMADLFANTCYRESLRAFTDPDKDRDALYSEMTNEAAIFKVDMDRDMLINIANHGGSVKLEFFPEFNAVKP